MPSKESFDITTGCDLQEVDNAVNQANKELSQRYDFKGVEYKLEFHRGEEKVVISAPDEFKLDAIWDVLHTKLLRREVPVKNLDRGEVQKASGFSVRQDIPIMQSIPTDTAKKIVKFLKDKKLKKVQSSIQKDQVRVTSPSRDSLQEVMGILRQEDFGIELNFGNFRSN
ncbi:MAG: YajQ family cyclic di-GMP-binding protein [Myxococcota bacterium]|nr:YajQ family cyclic di-GMP-binding protein [Myxococcota bacterium]